MWENVEEPIHVSTVAAAVGCGVRELLYTFKLTHGIGAVSYFKTQRLCAVHGILLKSESNRTISDIAADYGFWHMGHFGVDYKRRFGMTPSQTRRAVHRPGGAYFRVPLGVEHLRDRAATTVAITPYGTARHASRVTFPLALSGGTESSTCISGIPRGLQNEIC